MFRSHYFLTFALFASLLIGCQEGSKFPRTEMVEGTILLDGVPIPKASITFLPSGGGGEIASGFSDEQGRFTISSQNGAPGQGALIGEYRVTVSQVEVTYTPSPSDPEAGTTTAKELLPAIYRDKEKTPLNVSIQQGKNKVTLELTKQ
jgi:hypothetical protein